MRRPLVVSRCGATAAFAVGVIVASLMSGAGASAPRAAIPALERCSFLELWVDEGWWLQVGRNEPAAYGFGALPNRVTVKAGTFTVDEVYRAVIDHVATPHPDARVTVVFGPMASGYEGWVFALEGADPFVFELLPPPIANAIGPSTTASSKTRSARSIRSGPERRSCNRSARPAARRWTSGPESAADEGDGVAMT